MLIISQNKEVLVNFDVSAGIEIAEGTTKTVITSYITGCSYLLGEYSTKAKAMKVLDMVQEAYAEYKIDCTFFDRLYRTSNNCGIKRYLRQWF